MKILWLTNVPVPEASILMGEQIQPFGGWLDNTSKILSNDKQYEISMAFPKKGTSNVIELKGDLRDYYIFPEISTVNERSQTLISNSYLSKILDLISPDLVHIFGTEYPHTYAMTNLCKQRGIKTIINIQGLVSICEMHYSANLPFKVQKGKTFRDLLRRDSILKQKELFKIKGNLEIKALQNVENIIGRTTWDRACTHQINPVAKYYSCNETLREKFYTSGKWNLENCEKYTIFLSQASYPLKGLHMMLEAMPIILKEFPQAKIKIAGYNILETSKLKQSYYVKYIRSLVQKYNLEKCVSFMGLLNEKEMCEAYLDSHIFVCPSSIENSPNSLGEAMILGVPAIAADVGGVTDMVTHNLEGFVYPFDAPYMLAYYVCEIFKKEDLAQEFSSNAIKRASFTHAKEENQSRLIDIYKEILG